MRKTYLPLSDEDRNYLKSLSKKENHSGTSRGSCQDSFYIKPME